MFNDAKLGQGYREGIYEETTRVNGYPAWESTTGNAIWRSGSWWFFGPTSGIGGLFSGIRSKLGDDADCPDQVSSWEVLKEGNWTNATSDDVAFECYVFKGNI